MLRLLIISLTLFYTSSIAQETPQPINTEALEFLTSPEGQVFLEIYTTLQERYVDDLNSAELIHGAIIGMLESINDPYTFYTEPKTAAFARESRQGSFAGIGVYLSPEGISPVSVAKVIPNSPAEKAGIRSGDIFKRVDNQTTESLSPNEVASLTRGDIGSLTKLELLRPSENRLISFEIIRAEIELIAVKGVLLEQDIAYIRIDTFFQVNIDEQVRDVLDELINQNAKAIILDLRDNGGGFIYEAARVADMFLSSGNIFFERERKQLFPHLASAQSNDIDLPLTVLTNKGTASAAEVLLAALKDNNRAIVFGESSFGKSVEGELITLSNNAELQLTFREWLTPLYQSVNSEGVKPDVPITDSRFAQRFNIQGNGLPKQANIRILLNDEPIGQSNTNETGSFSFTGELEPLNIPAVPALNPLSANDLILNEAYFYLLEQIAH